jgi:hypothetical protein
MISDVYAALAAQAYRPLLACDFHRQALDPGDPAEAGQGGNPLNILEQSLHKNPLWTDFLSFRCPHSEAKDLNGGKLNKSNQGHGGTPQPFPGLNPG